MLYFFAHEVLDECSTFKFKFTKWRRRSFQWNEFSLSSSMTCIKFLKLKPLKIVSVSTSCPELPLLRSLSENTREGRSQGILRRTSNAYLI